MCCVQPFYHVLVDDRDRPGSQITYVAEENIRALGADDAEPVSHQAALQLLRPFDAAAGRRAKRPIIRTHARSVTHVA